MTPATNTIKTSFEKIFCIDTNIILNDVTNLEILSQKSSNLIVLPEIVMDELDAKKSGLEEINFQARAFGRLLEKADILSVTNLDDGTTISRMFINEGKDITIDVISKKEYTANERNSDKHILNDRKILEVAEYSSTYYPEDTMFISNDVMCRLRAISLGLKTEVLGKNVQDNIELYTELEVKEIPTNIEASLLNIPSTVFGLCLYTAEGDRKYFYKSGIVFYQIDEDDLKKQNIKPQNIEQKILSSMILDPYYDIIVCDAPAGSGKTAIALSAAMRLLDKNKDKYNKIVYMRKTVNAGDEEMGFLPGSAEEKLSPYLAPLYSNLEAIVSLKYKKKFNKEELEAKIQDMVKDYQITPMFEGFLRGTNIRDAIVIIDEIQNENISSIKTSLTRVTEGCKIIAIGSNKQIDNKYINKFSSSLTYLINRLLVDNNDVHIGSMVLTKTVRSRIAEWADNFR